MDEVVLGGASWGDLKKRWRRVIFCWDGRRENESPCFHIRGSGGCDGELAKCGWLAG